MKREHDIISYVRLSIIEFSIWILYFPFMLYFGVIKTFFKNVSLFSRKFLFCSFDWKKKPFVNYVMYWSNRSFNITPPGQPPGHLTVLKIIVQIPPHPGQNAVQMPHTRVHLGDQVLPPQGHFTGTKMTEGRQKRLQLSNKIFTNIKKTEKHC